MGIVKVKSLYLSITGTLISPKKRLSVTALFSTSTLKEVKFAGKVLKVPVLPNSKSS